MAATTSYAVSYSYDGQSFTQINTNYTANFSIVNDIKYGYDVNGVPMWVACGIAAQTGTSARTLQYSYTPTVDGAWQNLAFNLFSSGGRCVKCGKSTAGNVLWVAGGQGGNSLAYSTTGFTWTGLGTTQFIDYCSDVEYGTDGSGTPVWIAVGSGSGASGNTIAYSNDGVSWVGLGKQTFTSYGSSIAYGSDGSGAPLWVASGIGGNSLAYSRNPKIQSSWVGLGNTIATSGSNGLTYGVDSSNNPVWMLSSNIGTNNTVLYYSYNPTVAASWTNAFENDLFNGFGFQAEQEKKPKFIVGGKGVDNMRGSMDGQTWYYIKSPFLTATNDVCWSQQQQMWVAVGEGSKTLAYSSDGIKWTGLNLFKIRGKKVSFNAAENRWYATGEGKYTIVTSINAIDWQTYPDMSPIVLPYFTFTSGTSVKTLSSDGLYNVYLIAGSKSANTIASATLFSTENVSVNYLVIGQGGDSVSHGASLYYSGGGGAGAFIEGTQIVAGNTTPKTVNFSLLNKGLTTLTINSNNIVAGKGGNGGSGHGYDPPTPGTNGSSGGGGGKYKSSSYQPGALGSPPGFNGYTAEIRAPGAGGGAGGNATLSPGIGKKPSLPGIINVYGSTTYCAGGDNGITHRELQYGDGATGNKGGSQDYVYPGEPGAIIISISTYDI
jgi:hypothetical protein